MKAFGRCITKLSGGCLPWLMNVYSKRLYYTGDIDPIWFTQKTISINMLNIFVHILFNRLKGVPI